MAGNIDLWHSFNERNCSLAIINIGYWIVFWIRTSLRSTNASTNFRFSCNINWRTRWYSLLICSHHKTYITTIYIYSHRAVGGSWDTPFPQTENIALVVFSIILAVFQLNIGCIYCNRALDNGIACTENVLYMRAVGVDRNIAAYVTAQGSVDFWQIIRVGRSFFVPCPCIFIGVDRNVATYRIITINAGIGCKAIASTNYWPIPSQSQSAICILVFRSSCNDM